MNMLKAHRKRIDAVDKKIVKLLLLRFNLVKLIASYKKKNKLKITDKKRELQIIEHIKKYSNKKHQKLIVRIFKGIINYSKKMQR